MAKVNLDSFRAEYGTEGGPAYAPEMLASVWLYAYALSVTSSRRLEQCGERPQRVSADSGFFSHANLQAMEERNMDGYMPDSNLARVLNRGGRLHDRAIHPAHQRMRRKLRDPAGRALYARRKAIVEPVNGVLKEQRGMRRFRRKGLPKVAVEWTLASIAYNLTRMWRSN